MTRFHCLDCGDLRIDEVMHNLCTQNHNPGCPGGRVIPIATLCSEPTTIDESDLAPGMVVVAVDDDPLVPTSFLCSPDVVLGAGSASQWVAAIGMRSCLLVDDDVDEVRRVADMVYP